MKYLRILVIENDVLTATAIQEALTKAKHIVVGIARDHQEMRACLSETTPDVALVDIHLGNDTSDGISLVEELRRAYSFPIIYLTAYSDEGTVRRAKLTRPTAYMLKPFRPDEIAIQIEVAYHNHHQKQLDLSDGDHLYLPVDMGRRHIKIQKNDVLYLKAAKSYVEVYLKHQPDKPQLFSMNLSYLSQFFDGSQFYRISRSLVINLQHIDKIEKTQIFLAGVAKPIQYPENSHPELLRRIPVVKTA